MTKIYKGIKIDFHSKELLTVIEQLAFDNEFWVEDPQRDNEWVSEFFIWWIRYFNEISINVNNRLLLNFIDINFSTKHHYRRLDYLFKYYRHPYYFEDFFFKYNLKEYGISFRYLFILLILNIISSPSRYWDRYWDRYWHKYWRRYWRKYWYDDFFYYIKDIVTDIDRKLINEIESLSEKLYALSRTEYPENREELSNIVKKINNISQKLLYEQNIFLNELKKDSQINYRYHLKSIVQTYNPNERAFTSIESKSKQEDFVNFSLYTVPEFKTGTTILLQVFAHLAEKIEEAKEFAKILDEHAKLKGYKQLEETIVKGTRIDFKLTLTELGITEIKSMIWNGITNYVTFDVSIPNNYIKEFLVGKIFIIIDNIPIGEIYFKLNNAEENQKCKWIGLGKRYLFSFISYADKNKDRVEKDINIFETNKIPYYVDFKHLTAGMDKTEAAYKNVKKADAFYLYWSSYAKKSKKVLKEIKMALEVKDFKVENPPEIFPLIIENKPPKPSKELLKIGFDNNKINHYMETKNNNPWQSGTFYLFLFLIIIGSITLISNYVSGIILPIVLISTILIVTLISVIILRNMELIKENTFTKIIDKVLNSLPLLKNLSKKNK